MSEHLLARTPDDPFAVLLAARALASEEERRKTVRRAIVLVAVAILHVLFVSVFIISGRIPLPVHAKAPVEVQLRLLPLPFQRAVSPPKVINAVTAPLPRIREVVPGPMPITAPPVSPEQAEVNALRALGQALACGASRYEYLSPAERRLCRRIPWKMPAKNAIAVVPPPVPAPGQMTGAEAAAKMRNQAPPCPLLQNTPCNDEIIYGKGPH